MTEDMGWWDTQCSEHSTEHDKLLEVRTTRKPLGDVHAPPCPKDANGPHEGLFSSSLGAAVAARSADSDSAPLPTLRIRSRDKMARPHA